MSISRIIFGICGLFAILVSFSTVTNACSCGEPQSVCNAYSDASTVFVGKVIDGKAVETMSQMINAKTKDLTFKFLVTTAFLGAESGKEIDVHTGFGFGDCGIPFEKGQTYLVYAYNYDGEIKTGICSRTRPIAKTNDVRELQNLLLNGDTVITGLFKRYARSSLIAYPYEPIANQDVRLVADNGKEFTSKTDEEGKFMFRGLPGGRYKLSPKIEPGWEIEDYETKDFLLNAHGCTTRNLTLSNDSEVVVGVLDPDGHAVQNVWVEFVPLGIETIRDQFPREFSVTDPQGQLYEFGLPPGKYTVSINYFHAPEKKVPFPPTFYPNVIDRKQAKVIEIVPGAKIKDVVIRVPSFLKGREIVGTVVWPDGTPVRSADIGLTDVKARDVCVSDCVETDELGRFKLTGYEGRSYAIWARADKKSNKGTQIFRSETPEFTIGPEMKVFRLVMQRTQN